MVREVVLADTKDINILSQSLGYNRQTDDQVELQLKTILNSDVDELYVYDDGEVKGWIHIFISNRVTSVPFIEIGGLVVSSEFQRLGIGRELIQHVRKYALDNKMKIRVRCNSGREFAHKFYQSIGFTKVKDQYVFEPIYIYYQNM